MTNAGIQFCLLLTRSIENSTAKAFELSPEKVDIFHSHLHRQILLAKVTKNICT